MNPNDQNFYGYTPPTAQKYSNNKPKLIVIGIAIFLVLAIVLLFFSSRSKDNSSLTLGQIISRQQTLSDALDDFRQDPSDLKTQNLMATATVILNDNTSELSEFAEEASKAATDSKIKQELQEAKDLSTLDEIVPKILEREINANLTDLSSVYAKTKKGGKLAEAIEDAYADQEALIK